MRRQNGFGKKLFINIAALAVAAVIVIGLNQLLGDPLELPKLPAPDQIPGVSDAIAQVGDAVSSAVDNVYREMELAEPAAAAEGDLLVHFVDVGQADCELIQAPDATVLIDAGDLGEGDRVIDYLRAQGVDRIDYLIATHPHADHIGGMPEVVEEFGIGKVLFSEVPENILPTSRVYERLLDSIAEKNLKITRAKPGNVYDLGGGATLKLLAPLGAYNDLNNCSVVCRLDFGETSFLFTGDAETESEDDMLEEYGKSGLRADVLKLGHHGSSTSSQEKWLDAVDPEIVVAQVGADNKYGHPHKETLQKIKERGLAFYRTDLDGSIVMASDGMELKISA